MLMFACLFVAVI